MNELPVSLGNAGYLIAVIKEMSSVDNFNSFRLHAMSSIYRSIYLFGDNSCI